MPCSQRCRKNRLGTEPAGINNDRIGSRLQRSYGARAITRVTLPHVSQNIGIYSFRTPLPQLLKPPRGALFERGSNKQLQCRSRANDGPDVPAIQNRPFRPLRRRLGETPLKVKQSLSNRWIGSHPGCRLRRRIESQGRLFKVRWPERRGRSHGIASVGVRPGTDRPIQQTRIEVGEIQVCCNPTRQRSLASGGRPINGDDR